MRKRSLILVDRDGTLIEECEYLKDPAQVRLLPGATKGIRDLKKAGFIVAVVSNQSGVGRGLITRTEMNRVNRRFLSLLKQKKARVDGLYLCPHRPADHCACRKPKLGMAKQASRELRVPWKNSISVGDRPSDVELGQRTRGKGVLVLTGYGRRWAKKHASVHPDHVAKDFRHAAAWIIRNKE